MNTESTHSVVIEKDLPHPPEKVWRALTQEALIKEWLMDNDFQPTLGRKFQLRATPVPGWNGIIDGEVLALESNKKLVYTWASMGLATQVEFTLTPTANGTHLRMEHSGFGSDKDANYNGAKWGWTKFLGNMEKVLAKP
jgi:uncharacterized protein YndB with AHSA1/START domain